jgi:hypothetical protein
MILPWDDDRAIKGKIVPLERVVLAEATAGKALFAQQ